MRLVGHGLPSPRSLLSRAGAYLRGLGRPAVVVGLALVAGGAGAGVHRVVTRSSHFAVRELRFSSLEHVTPESLAARAGEVVGGNLFTVPLDEIARAVSQEPWVASARARRELPSTVMVDIIEREARCVVALGPLYLADAQGAVFKRATPDEAAALPVVTGLERDGYLADPARAQAEVRQALAAVEKWGGARPAIGEAHVDRVQGVVLYTTDGVAVRLGLVDESLPERLERFDAVWAALAASGEKPRVIHLDHRARPDRVTVKLAKQKSDPKGPET